MSYCVDLISEDSFYENITLGVTKHLEADPRICNVTVERIMPCDRVALSTWEQRHSAILPEDLRNFYASTDGFQLTWHYKYSDMERTVGHSSNFHLLIKSILITTTDGVLQIEADDILPVGSISINSLSALCLSPSLKDILDFSLTRHQKGNRPSLNTKSKLFELDNCRNIGKVCLVFTNGSWSVWLATREGTWGWLANSFTNYFRMALVHLGLPGWQALFADMPLIPWAEQLFLLLAPHLLEKNENEKNPTTAGETILNHIDPNIFKSKLNKKVSA